MQPSHAILLIDDDARSIRLLSEMLRSEGYRLFAALGGRAGFDQAMQMQMPSVQGHTSSGRHPHHFLDRFGPACSFICAWRIGREATCGPRRIGAQVPMPWRRARNLSHTPTLRELAHAVASNERSLSEVFHQNTGLSVFEFLRLERFRAACDLLLHKRDAHEPYRRGAWLQDPDLVLAGVSRPKRYEPEGIPPECRALA
ncbi:hypothetical protein LNV07_11710 [Paucibacter oligotrophus]|uniref:Response regulatory domain-containing protein n=1 Tax=Roseateles oligotrophus TaxID=1769250 RepID=A0ABT2YFC5_9BURK|nr:hypothetical protein [Roseateles oligotrophus]MCV2368753.1 hypothetical protein [Roseateles oligotrophus]